MQWSLIHNRAHNTLSYTHRCMWAGEVSLTRSMFHSFERSHTTILLQTHTITIEILARSLFSSSKHASHHHSASTQTQGLCDVTHITNTTISNHRNTKLRTILCQEINSWTLTTTHSTHLLCCANWTHTHTNMNTIHTSLDKMLALTHSYHITTHHINLRIIRLQPTNHLQLETGITLWGIHHQHIHTSFDKSLSSILINRTCANRSSTHQTALWIRSCHREITVLDEISTRHQCHNVAITIHHRKLSHLTLAQQFHSLCRIHLITHSLDILRSHHILYLCGGIFYKIDITTSHNSKKLLS